MQQLQLKTALIQRRILQNALVEILGVSRSTIHRIVNEESDPTPDQKRAIAQFLKCRQCDLWPKPQSRK